MCLIEQLNLKKEIGAVAFVKFTLDAPRFNSDLFCFYEGEDYKYYIPRIETHTKYTNQQIRTYKCGNRTGVIDAMQMINKEKGSEIYRTAFFIDRDYFKTDIVKENFYQTPYYSIENFYVSENSLKTLIQSEFGVNHNDEDFLLIVELFKKLYKEYLDYSLIVNSWMRAVRKHHSNDKLSFSNITFSKLFYPIENDSIKPKIEITLENLNKFFENLSVLETEFEESRQWFINNEHAHYYFRGKMEFEFLKKFLEYICKLNKDGKLNKKHTSVEIYSGNCLSLFSKYAYTPTCLVEFLSTYK